ncbi:MAG: ATP-dependent RecD-like DNA helicase, partial [Synergistaceae bacterium]|nr:ATP-dependent RecD-like DNA helicase [Synergistaceae bacterium]
MEKLQCVIERITYHNDENGYTVIRCSAGGYSDLITAVGSMPGVHVGSVFNLYGSWKVNPKYGQQFCFQKCEETLPATVGGLQKYLGSGLIKGIGPVYAGKIIEHFGEKTLDILDKAPDKLSEVQGIGKVRIAKIKKSWLEQKEIKNIMLFLQSYNVSTSLATKIFKQYGSQAIQIVTENPYRLADDIWGVGFKTADTIAENLGFGHERYERLRSGIMYTLNKFSDEGHCYANMPELVAASVEILEVDAALIEEAVEKMISGEDVIQEDSAVYLPVYYYSELGTARRLLRLIDSAKSIYFENDEIVRAG